MDALGIADGTSSPTSAPAAAGSPCGSRGASVRRASSTPRTCSAQMIEAIERRVQREGLRNVRMVLGTLGRSEAAARALNAVLIVDVYHEVESRWSCCATCAMR